jgi:hypothetical protein
VLSGESHQLEAARSAAALASAPAPE